MLVLSYALASHNVYSIIIYICPLYSPRKIFSLYIISFLTSNILYISSSIRKYLY
jgi:hypothetical protein